jgi:outer membrane protein TolC
MHTRYFAVHVQGLTLALALLSGGITLRAQAPATPLTLEQVLQLAEEKSESIAVAAAGIRRAEGEQARARSGLFPQVDLSAGYDRALASEFSGLFDSTGTTTCSQFNPIPTSSIESRVAEIERALDCGAVGGGLLGGDGQASSDSGDDAAVLPFGRSNTWHLNLTLSQSVFSGGRIAAQREIAAVGHESADLALTSARAQVLFQTTQAYYDAALSDRLVAIALDNVRQAEVTLQQAQIRFGAGTVPEFEVLRARVGRDNLTPQVIRQRANRQIAYLRLKQLLDLPAETDLQLAVSLDEAEAPPAAFAPRLASAEASVAGALAADAPEQQPGQLSDVPRVAVRQADADRRAREAALRLTTAQRRASVSVNSFFGRVAYPTGIIPAWNDQRTNWTIGAAVQWPVLTGGRQRADEAISRAELEQAQTQLRQTDELATLDGRSAWAELVAARATWNASAGTVEEATRAYQIAEARYNAGVSTQLELSDSRLLLAQAQGNRAQAAHDLQVARARIALLPELPLGTVAQGGSASQPATVLQSAPAVPPPSGGASQFTNTSASQAGGNR